MGALGYVFLFHIVACSILAVYVLFLCFRYGNSITTMHFLLELLTVLPEEVSITGAQSFRQEGVLRIIQR